MSSLVLRAPLPQGVHKIQSLSLQSHVTLLQAHLVFGACFAKGMDVIVLKSHNFLGNGKLPKGSLSRKLSCMKVKNHKFPKNHNAALSLQEYFIQINVATNTFQKIASSFAHRTFSQLLSSVLFFSIRIFLYQRTLKFFSLTSTITTCIPFSAVGHHG